MCDYRKDTAWFKRYTKEQRREIEKEVDKQKEKQEKNEMKVKCLCWRKGTGNCPKHNHEVIWKENECLNCKKKNEKQNNYENQDNKEKHHEEKPIVKEAYFWDDEVLEYREAYLKWNLVTNTNIAMGNYVNNEILIQENQRLREYHERQSKIIKDLGDTIQELKEENQEYKRLFDEWWKENQPQPMEIDDIKDKENDKDDDNQDIMRIDEIMYLDEIMIEGY